MYYMLSLILKGPDPDPETKMEQLTQTIHRLMSQIKHHQREKDEQSIYFQNQINRVKSNSKKLKIQNSELTNCNTKLVEQMDRLKLQIKNNNKEKEELKNYYQKETRILKRKLRTMKHRYEFAENHEINTENEDSKINDQKPISSVSNPPSDQVSMPEQDDEKEKLLPVDPTKFLFDHECLTIDYLSPELKLTLTMSHSELVMRMKEFERKKDDDEKSDFCGWQGVFNEQEIEMKRMNPYYSAQMTKRWEQLEPLALIRLASRQVCRYCYNKDDYVDKYCICWECGSRMHYDCVGVNIVDVDIQDLLNKPWSCDRCASES